MDKNNNNIELSSAEEKLTNFASQIKELPKTLLPKLGELQLAENITDAQKSILLEVSTAIYDAHLEAKRLLPLDEEDLLFEARMKESKAKLLDSLGFDKD